jgi:hypothetical protein
MILPVDTTIKEEESLWDSSNFARLDISRSYLLHSLDEAEVSIPKSTREVIEGTKWAVYLQSQKVVARMLLPSKVLNILRLLKLPNLSVLNFLSEA